MVTAWLYLHRLLIINRWGNVAVAIGRGMTRAYIMYTICNSLESQLLFRLIKCFLVCLKKIDYSLVIAKKRGCIVYYDAPSCNFMNTLSIHLFLSRHNYFANCSWMKASISGM